MIILEAFCDKDLNFPDLVKPFNHGGFTYATDGFIIVRVPLIGKYNYENICLPNPDGLKWVPDHETAWHKAEDIKGPDIIACPSCDEGIIFPEYIKFGTFVIQGKYLLLIKELPDAHLHLPINIDGSINFKFLGGSGILMKCKEVKINER